MAVQFNILGRLNPDPSPIQLVFFSVKVNPFKMKQAGEDWLVKILMVTCIVGEP